MKTKIKELDTIIDKLKSEIERICKELNIENPFDEDWYIIPSDGIHISIPKSARFIPNRDRAHFILTYKDENKIPIEIEDYIQDYFIPKYLYLERHMIGYALINKQNKYIKFLIEILPKSESLYWTH